MKKLILIIGLLALPFASQADNDWRQHHGRHSDHHFWQKVDQRLNRQYRRIENGIARGDLTHWEAKKLHRQHHKLDRRVERLRHKPWLSERHKYKVMSRLNRASETIYQLKHNEHYVQRKLHRYDRHNRTAWANNGYRAGFYFDF